MHEEESKMHWKDAVQIIRTYESDVIDGKITDPKIKKDLDIARKIVHDRYIRIFRRMR